MLDGYLIIHVQYYSELHKITEKNRGKPPQQYLSCIPQKTYFIPRFIASAVPIIEMPSNMLLQILAAYQQHKTTL